MRLINKIMKRSRENLIILFLRENRFWVSIMKTIEIRVRIPVGLYKRLSRLIEDGMVGGTIEEIIVDALRDYVSEAERVEKAAEVFEW